MTTWYILPDLDQLCLKCPVPHRCNETDPRCLRRQALTDGDVSQRKPSIRETQVLDYLEKHPGTSYRAMDVARAIGTPYRSILHVFRRLQTQGKVTRTRRRNILLWTAKDSP